MTPIDQLRFITESAAGRAAAQCGVDMPVSHGGFIE